MMISILLATLAIQSQPLTAGKVYDFPGGGHFDYMAVDTKLNRVFASHPSAKMLSVLDLAAGTVKEIEVGEVNGVQIDNKLNKIFLAGGGGKLVALNRDTLAKEGEVTFDGPGDDLVVDTKRQEIYVCHDDGTNDWVVDANTLKIVGSVTVAGAPEYVLYDSKTDKVYQNIKPTNQLQVIDPETKKVISTWQTEPETSPHGLAIDRSTGHAFSAGRNGKLDEIDLATGKIITTVDIAPGTDQIAWDSKLKRVYCASTGAISVVQETEDGAKLLGNVPDQKGAHTICVNSTTHDVFVVWGDSAGSHIQQYTSTP